MGMSITTNKGSSSSSMSITTNKGSSSSSITSSSNSNSRSSSITNSGYRGSNNMGRVANMLNRLVYTNSNILNSMDWGVDRGDHLLGRVGLNGSMVDMRGLNNLLNRVDLVGSSNRDSNIIRSSNMLVDSDDTLNRSWDMDGHINIVLLYIDLRDDVSSLGSDPGVSSHWGKNSLLSDSVSRSITCRDWCRGDGSIRCRWSRDHWSRQSNGINKVLGNTSSIRDSGLSNMLNTTNTVSMTSNNRLDSSLDHLMSNNTIFNTALNLSRSSDIGLVGPSNNCWGRDHWGTSY